MDIKKLIDTDYLTEIRNNRRGNGQLGKLNNLCSLFKNMVNSLIKNHISYDYIKNDCINILENKLLTINRLNNVDESLEWYIKEYFDDQSIR